MKKTIVDGSTAVIRQMEKQHKDGMKRLSKENAKLNEKPDISTEEILEFMKVYRKLTMDKCGGTFTKCIELKAKISSLELTVIGADGPSIPGGCLKDGKQTRRRDEAVDGGERRIAEKARGRKALTTTTTLLPAECRLRRRPRLFFANRDSSQSNVCLFFCRGCRSSSGGDDHNGCDHRRRMYWLNGGVGGHVDFHDGASLTMAAEDAFCIGSFSGPFTVTDCSSPPSVVPKALAASSFLSFSSTANASVWSKLLSYFSVIVISLQTCPRKK